MRFWKKARQLDETGGNPDQAQAAKIIAYIIFVLTIIFALIILFLRKRIAIAVEVVKEASRAISDLKSAILFPIFPLILGLAYFVFWTWGCLTIFSVRTSTKVEIASGDRAGIQTIYAWQKAQSDLPPISNPPDTPAFIEYTAYEFDEEMQKPFVVFFFHLLWNVQFLIYLTFGVISGAIADWYFTKRDENGKKIRGNGEGELCRCPILSSFCRIVKFHLGTILFGAFIIACVQLIRAAVKYIEENSKGKANKVQKAIFCAIQCCLKCLECCLDKLSKNAFIWNAIYGDCFCYSAAASFKLLWRNLARVAAINMVSGYLLLIGKVVVAVLTAGIVGLILTAAEPFKTEVGSPVFPVLVTMLLAFMVASLFMVVYETTIDTIFLCFLVDEEDGGDMFAGKSLQKVIGKYADASKDIAEKAKAAPGERGSIGGENGVALG